MEIKNYEFYCPACGEKLSHDRIIELITVRQNGDKGIIYLDVSIGSYHYRHDPPVNFFKGELVEFQCPKCKGDLRSAQYENFAELTMKVGKGIEFNVLFSREAGKRKTYVITDDGIESYSEK